LFLDSFSVLLRMLSSKAGRVPKILWHKYAIRMRG
jgi:hypothetical protein